jgi:hypothetical protein
VVGEGDDGKTARPRQVDQFFRRKFAVRRVGVGVQVDAPRPAF